MSERRPTQLKDLTDRITPEGEMLAEGREPPHHSSITEVVDVAIASGVPLVAPSAEEIPGEDEVLRAGDPDVDPLMIEFVGEEAAGGSNASPDSNDVDKIGRLYGVAGADKGELILGEDLIAPRDTHRWENNPASRDKS